MPPKTNPTHRRHNSVKIDDMTIQNTSYINFILILSVLNAGQR